MEIFTKLIDDLQKAVNNIVTVIKMQRIDFLALKEKVERLEEKLEKQNENIK